MHLAARNLRISFSKRPDAVPVVDVAEFNATPGQLIVLTGPSGSGKTSLLNVLSGLSLPQAGEISWQGVDIVSMGEGARDKWRCDHAGLIFQNFHLIPEMTPLQNVILPVYFGQLTAGDYRQTAIELLERFNVPMAQRRTDSFSRGEQQRIALARALIFDPEVIFADEPTASLDPENAVVLAQALQDMAQTRGKTVIVVSHDEALIERADIVARLAHGKIAPAVLEAA